MLRLQLGVVNLPHQGDTTITEDCAFKGLISFVSYDDQSTNHNQAEYSSTTINN